MQQGGEKMKLSNAAKKKRWGSTWCRKIGHTHHMNSWQGKKLTSKHLHYASMSPACFIVISKHPPPPRL